ncbi:hypothetical protein QC761_213350 [Podospora bellae-mahoneyi]|uniref:Malate dehydrogenase n=2 Tax=Podospora TaxID=5144 RepID=A0ABY6S4G9_PODCO|nr:hypothetical protein QC761_213350 [Podospora bellae-mahoneyi]VBB76470.1 Putative protein of unknown function [Podospora comata]
MVSVKSILLAAMATVAYAAPCQPTFVPTLPKTGGARELPSPPPSFTLKKIAVGHGIQNYTCVDTTSAPKADGAVAILYDVTKYAPGTPKTGIAKALWDRIPSALLLKPLTLNKLAGTKYGAHATAPFPKEEDLKLLGFPIAEYLGHHYFDISSTPMFDLNRVGLKASVTKLDNVDAPANADKGPLKTGAVAWLQLGDSGKGLSSGITQVYRVITAGGVGQKCDVAGVGVHSVPYTTFYWFF